MSLQIATSTFDSPVNRLATRAIFFVTGLAMGLWAALVPYAQMRTQAEAGDLGLLLLCLGSGSLLAMFGSGRLIGRFGCRSMIVIGIALFCLTLPPLAMLSDIRLLAVALFIFGMGIGLTDVAMNVQGTLIEQASDKPLMSGFHCLYSVGGIVGAGGGALLLGAGLPPLHSAGYAVVLVLLITALFFNRLLPTGGHEEENHESGRKARPNFRLVLMAVMAMICFMGEGAVLDWSGVFLTQDRALALEHAGWGYAIFAITMSIMRLTGDAVVKKLGRKKVLVLGALMGIAGYLLVVIAPGWSNALLGFALVGIGVANIVPVLITLAGQEKVMPVNMSVAMVATLGYLGVLAGPAFLGFVAHLFSLTAAFSMMAALFIVISVGAYKLKY